VRVSFINSKFLYGSTQTTLTEEVSIGEVEVSFLGEDPFLGDASCLEVAFSFLVEHLPCLEVDPSYLEVVI
jgi:hypothetical protein